MKIVQICLILIFGLFNPKTELKYAKSPVATEIHYISNYKAEKLKVIMFIKTHEGFSSQEYSDSGYRAIGYGCRLIYHPNQFIPVLGITENQADSLLKVSLNRNIQYVKINFPLLNKNQTLAMAYLGYCIGIGSILKHQITSNLRSNNDIESNYPISGRLKEFQLKLFYGKEQE